MIVTVYLEEVAAVRLKVICKELDRTLPDLCESAISEALLDSFRHRKDDPAKLLKQGQDK